MPRKAAHPNCLIIAGPNGAEKTTFAAEFLPLYFQYLDFINPDLIVRQFQHPVSDRCFHIMSLRYLRAGTISFVPAGTGSVSLRNPPLKTVGYFRPSLTGLQAAKLRCEPLKDRADERGI